MTQPVSKEVSLRFSRVALIGLGVGVVLMVGTTGHWFVRHRAELIAQFSEQRLHVLQGLVQEVTDDLNDLANFVRGLKRRVEVLLGGAKGDQRIEGPDARVRLHLLFGEGPCPIAVGRAQGRNTEQRAKADHDEPVEPQRPQQAEAAGRAARTISLSIIEVG